MSEEPVIDDGFGAPNDFARFELAETIKRKRIAMFGSKKAAYVKADVNSATWDRVEAGEPVRTDRLAQIVRTLWPESDGQWQYVFTGVTVGPRSQDAGYVAAPGPLAVPGITNEDLMREILRSRSEYDQLRAGQDDLAASLREVSERVARLESPS